MDTLPKDKPFDLKIRDLVTKTAWSSFGLRTRMPEGDRGSEVHVTITRTTFGRDVRRNPLAEYRKAVGETYHQLDKKEKTIFFPYRFEVSLGDETDKYTVAESLMRVVTRE